MTIKNTVMFNHNSIRDWFWRKNGFRPDFPKTSREQDTRFGSEYARQLEQKIMEITGEHPEIIKYFEDVST